MFGKHVSFTKHWCIHHVAVCQVTDIEMADQSNLGGQRKLMCGARGTGGEGGGLMLSCGQESQGWGWTGGL